MRYISVVGAVHVDSMEAIMVVVTGRLLMAHVMLGAAPELLGADHRHGGELS